MSGIGKNPSAGAPAFLALACVGTLFSAASAGAATPADSGAAAAPAADPTGAVEDPASQITVTGRYAQPDVASSKATAPLLNTPQTITILDHATLQQQNLLSLKDALSTLPGITFGAGEGGGGFGDSINLRGFTANTDITIDGVRDSAQYSRSDTFDIDQIEVYNGANSVFNGSGSVGGTINLVQKQPKAKSATYLIGGIGTDNYYRATLDSNVRVNDLIAVRLNAMYHRNDIPGRDVENARRWGIAPAVTIGIDSPTYLTLMYVYQHDNNVPQYGVPYFPAAGGKPAGVPYSGYYGFRNVDRQRSDLNQATAIFNHDVSDHFSIRNLTRYENIRQLTVVDPPQGGVYALNGQCYGNSGVTAANADGTCTYAQVAAVGTTPATTIRVPQGYYLAGGPRGNLRNARNQLGYDQLDLRGEFTTGILEHNLVFGGAATWEHYDLDTGRVELNADGSNPYLTTGLPLINIADPSSMIVGPSVTNSLGQAVGYGSNLYTGPYHYIRSGLSYGDHTDYATYLFDTTKIGKLFEVNFGLRWEHSEGTFRSDTVATTGASLGLITVGGTQKNSDNLFSYRGGLVFKPTPATSLYVSYGNSHTPSITSVNGGCTSGSGATLVNFCDVKPEGAETYEVGGKADLFNHRLQLTAAVFRNIRSNFKVASNDPTLPSQQVPDGRARVDGIALGASGSITSRWTIFANYNYLKSKVERGVSQFCVANPTNAACVTAIAAAPEAGGPLQQTPKNSGSLFTTYTFPFKLQLGYGLTYQGAFAIVTNPSAKINGQYPSSNDYWTHRFYLAYPITHRLLAQVNVQNVTNAHYYTSIRNNGWAVPGAGRSATGSLQFEF